MKKIITLMGTFAFACMANAQSLPRPVWTCDFEGVSSAADLNAEQVGAGLFLQSADENFGTYYQNNPEGVKTSHANYLIIPTQAFINSKANSAEQLTIGFWVNASVANEKQGMDGNGHYFSTLIAGYSRSSSYKTFSWPMFSARTRQTLQINCAGWSDFVNEENVNGANVESNAWIATKTQPSGEVDEEGNEILVPTEFDDNWHYVALTFNGLNAKFYVDGEIKNEWNATNNSYCFPAAMGELDDLYLGDCGPFWQDKDGAYAYDDISFYSSELTKEQIELVMRLKHNELTEEDRVVLALAQLQDARDALEEYVSSLGESFGEITSDVTDWLVEEIDSKSYETISDVNAALNAIQAKKEEIIPVVNAYNGAMKVINYYADYCNNTAYSGADEFISAITAAQESLTGKMTKESIAATLSTLDSAKAAYVYTQTPDANGTIDVTRLIDNPWFCEESNEPVLGEDGVATYAEGAAVCERGAWEPYTTLTSNKDCTMYYTQGRTTWNNFHDSTVKGAVLDIHQQLSGLKPGYYTVSADMVSNTGATDNHVYATADNVTKVSAVFSTTGWDGIAAGVGKWETLTTDKVRVGEDGTLTIGATSTTNGAAYAGWYCVTNFRLTYYGTEADLAADVVAKADEVRAAIDRLYMAGDKKHANDDLATTLASDASDYDKVSHLTDLLKLVNDYYAQEVAFTGFNEIQDLAKNASDATVKSIYENGAKDIEAVLAGEDATVDVLPGLTDLFKAYTSYVASVQAAQAWGTEAAANEVKVQVAAISGATVETLAEYSAKLVDIMKSSISEFTASEAEPKEITGILVNPSFTGDSNAGWTISGACANWYSECEFYNTNFDIYQVISGLPAGAYRVAVQGYYRDGGRDAAVNNYNTVDEEGNNAYTANAELYANDFASPLISIASYNIKGEVPSTHADGNAYAWYQPNADDELENVISYPDGMNSAWYMMNELGMYADNSVNVMIAEGEDLKLGIRKSTTISTDWAIFDNFRLFYLGTEAPTAIDSAINSASAPSAIYSLSGVKTSSLQKGINIVKMSNGKVQKVIVK